MTKPLRRQERPTFPTTGDGSVHAAQLMLGGVQRLRGAVFLRFSCRIHHSGTCQHPVRARPDLECLHVVTGTAAAVRVPVNDLGGVRLRRGIMVEGNAHCSSSRTAPRETQKCGRRGRQHVVGDSHSCLHPFAFGHAEKTARLS